MQFSPPEPTQDQELRLNRFRNFAPELKKLEAHRFAGLYKCETPGAAPENYVHEFTSPLTLFEGRNVFILFWSSGFLTYFSSIMMPGDFRKNSRRDADPATEGFCLAEELTGQ
jgi:hypothetical protein